MPIGSHHTVRPARVAVQVSIRDRSPDVEALLEELRAGGFEPTPFMTQMPARANSREQPLSCDRSQPEDDGYHEDHGAESSDSQSRESDPPSLPTTLVLIDEWTAAQYDEILACFECPVVVIVEPDSIDTVLERHGSWIAEVLPRPVHKSLAIRRIKAHMDVLRYRSLTQDASRAKSDFIKTMSHEIRTPLNAIIGMSELLSATPLTRLQQEYVRVLRRASENLLRLVTDVLDLSRLETGRFELDAIPFNLPALVHETCEMLALSAHEKSLELDYRIDSQIPEHLIGDPTRLRQVLVNLLGNAIKFTRSGTIRVDVEPEGAIGAVSPHVHVRFCVSDTGVGIPSTKISSIFDNFVQADSGPSRKFDGTGLGLSICQKISRLMNGALWVESEEGRGSRFFITARLGLNSEVVAADLAIPIGNIEVVTIVTDSQRRTKIEDILGQLRIKTVSDKLSPRDDQNLTLRIGVIDVNEVRNHATSWRSVVTDHLEHLDRVLLLVDTTDPGSTIRFCDTHKKIHYVTKPIGKASLARAIQFLIEDRQELAFVETDSQVTRKGLKVLVVEDSSDNRLVIGTYLTQANHIVTEATNGKEALDLFRPGRFDVILMDIQMPILDGLTATRWIRRIERKHAADPVKIISLTADATMEAAQNSRDAGCDRHLIKPIDHDSLLRELQSIAQNQQPDPDATPFSMPSPHISTNLEEKIRQRIPIFLRNRIRDLDVMREGFRDGDQDLIRDRAHQIKGVGTSYGFPTLTELARYLEQACVDKESVAVARLLESLDEYLHKIQTIYGRGVNGEL